MGLLTTLAYLAGSLSAKVGLRIDVPEKKWDNLWDGVAKDQGFKDRIEMWDAKSTKDEPDAGND